MKRRFWLPLVAMALPVFHPLSAEPLFPNSSYPASGFPFGVATGDFNRDGNPDVAMADFEFEPDNVLPTGYALVRYGLGDGTFGGEVRFPCGIAPTSIAAGDVNGDSIVDLVLTDDWDHQVRTLLGTDGGGFGGPIAQTLGGAPTSVRLLDLDGHGPLDIVVVDQDRLAIAYNFDFGNQVTVFLGYQASDVTAGDFNGDSRPDLVTPFGLYLNTGQGGFQFGGSLSVFNSSGVSTGDFDGDGLLDLAVTQYSGALIVLRGLGNGTFSTLAALPAGSSASHPTVEDFDGDGHLDIVMISGPLGYIHGRGDGTFDGIVQFGFGLEGLSGFATADLNGDSKIDIVLIGPTVVLGGPGGFISAVRLGSDPAPRSVAVADFNADGSLDVAIGADSVVSIFSGQGDGAFVPSQSISVRGFSSSLGSGDLNGDGKLDLVVTQGKQFSDCLGISILLGNGNGTFTASGEVSAGCQPFSVGLGDFNRDHKLDLAVANRASSFGSILLGKGDGTFDPPISLAFESASNGVAVGDFDADGDDDVAFTNLNILTNTVSVFLSRGDGTFNPESSFPVGDESHGVIARDLNGDGNLDLAIANRVSSDVSVLLGRGDGTFDPDQRFQAGTGPEFLTAGDFDADGDDDLAVNAGGAVTILLGQGDGTFYDVAERLTVVQALGIASGDFNADGRSDLAVAASTSVVLLSQSPSDADGDGIPDDRDPCTDRDGDGFGDPGFENNTCAQDNCPDLSNPGQEDADGDFVGDACDPCPLDIYNDEDHDGFCADVDNCSFVYNPGQEPGPDLDGDGILDECDNCPTIANHDQADTLHQDGWGDACEPFIKILDVREDGGTDLEVTAQAGDPQGENLSGSISFNGRENVTLQNPASGTPSCGMDRFPNGPPGTGLAYIVENGHSILFDIDARLGCSDGQPDFEVAAGLQQGACSDSQTVFSPSIDLTALGFHPLLCVRRVGHPESEFELVYFYDQDSFGGQYYSHLSIPFESWPPPKADISALTHGLVYLLDIYVTDGNTGTPNDVHYFLYQGETYLVLQSPSGPEAVISTDAEVECNGPGVGAVVLDGSASTPSAGSTLVSYEWFVDFGEVSQQLLGTGAILNATLPLGASNVTLRVTDNQGQTGTTAASIMVRDTAPPSFLLTLDHSTLWPPNHSMVDVHASWTVLDVCDPSPAVRLVSVTSSEPEDAHGNNDGNTGADILGADVGEADGVFALRSERSSAGPGRTYEITYRAVDASGNAVPALAMVTVPHDQGSGPEPLHLRVENAGSPGAALVYWNSVGGALAYDLIAGDLSSVRISAGRTSLGRVLLLARSTVGLSWSEGSGGGVPALGQVLFYLVQYRNAQGGTGYGTESAPWPREPESYDGGASGQPGSTAGGSTRERIAGEGGSP